MVSPFPCYPSSAVFAECSLPRRFEGLEKFIGLEESTER